MLINDLNICEKISEETSPDFSKSLSQYVRITIRGKLGRTVTVLLHEDLLQHVKMIITYRQNAGVPEDKPYIFGIPSRNVQKHKYLRACVLVRIFSVAAGAQFPQTLRGTILRRHIATICISLDIPENRVNDHADFMGHNEKIHKSYYSQSIITRDLAISRLLKHAQGSVSPENEESDEDNELSRTRSCSVSKNAEIETETADGNADSDADSNAESEDTTEKKRKQCKKPFYAPPRRTSARVRWSNEEPLKNIKHFEKYRKYSFSSNTYRLQEKR